MYCSQTAIENAVELTLLVGLTDDEQTGNVSSLRVTEAIADADAVIDGHLRGRYSVPLAVTPRLIQKLSVDLTLFGLFSRRAAHFEMPQHVRDRYKIALEMLTAIREGRMDLGVEPPPAESSAIVADTDGPERQFTAETMKDF